MRCLLAVILILGLAGTSAAVEVANHNIPPDKDTYVGDNMGDGREGGESWGDALPIGALPYTDTGATCDNTNDITLPCAASNAPDVVYSFTAGGSNMSINVSLCGSGYDCALGIYDANQNNIACNDDYCGLQSQIDNISVPAGATIYIVIDGFSTNCGSYIMNVTENVPCVVDCPAGALLEGEPECGPDYTDTYNGGCNSSPWVFQGLCPQAGNAAVMCGKSGTYLYFGLNYRDTDWFECYGIGATMTAVCRAEFPLQFIFIYGADCNNLQYDITTAPACVDAILSRYVAAGTRTWIWVGASQFDGIPCDSDYVLTMTGIGEGPLCPPTPTERTSWGSIKSLYK